MAKINSGRISDSVRQHAQEKYVLPARRRGEKTLVINVGEVHRAAALSNRVPQVCQALESGKFLRANALRIVSKTGPPSGQSTTVTYTYEFLDAGRSSAVNHNDDPWIRLRGALKDIFTGMGGGEAYLRAERENFRTPKDSE